jgi:hypothetical protein
MTRLTYLIVENLVNLKFPSFGRHDVNFFIKGRTTPLTSAHNNFISSG